MFDIKDVVKNIFNQILDEAKTKENINKIENNLIEPLIRYTFARVSTYITILFLIFILIFILIISILLMQIKLINNAHYL
jgi:hypothetical protein|tara:strand:- start:192 stop:431 length:240 start_codon:yes stop_codon:yes gene_type:complete